jgi:hypothetical protein
VSDSKLVPKVRVELTPGCPDRFLSCVAFVVIGLFGLS